MTPLLMAFALRGHRAPLAAFEVRSRTGLTALMNGVPVVSGTWFQYYEPGWTKGYYSSMSQDQTIAKGADGSTVVTFRNPDGQAHGKQTYTPTPKGFRVRYEFDWDGDRPVLVELTGGMLWAPAVQAESLRVDGRTQRSLRLRDYPGDASIKGRSYGGAASDFTFDGPLGRIRVHGSDPRWTLFDARGYPQPWAARNDLLWLGVGDLEVRPGVPTVLEQEWEFEPRAVAPPKSAIVRGQARALAEAALPGEPLPLVPKPKEVTFGSGAYTLGSHPEFALPARDREAIPRYREFLGGLWTPAPGPSGRIVGRVRDLGLPAEGYEVRVGSDGAMVVGQDEDGLRHGLYTLLIRARPEKGRLVVPQGVVRDWPTVPWRGVHMFVGPTAQTFQDKLWRRALLPLKLNKAVLQCERTAWKATPGVDTAITMRREELRGLFEQYRSYGVEPIPLIESFGHMEWLFANGKNLDLAINRDVPYAIDPENPAARAKIGEVWDEAIALLRPKTVHFGLDEVDMRGFADDDPARITRLWQGQLSFLGSLAARHGVVPMLWGDHVLAPGEAIDVALGGTPEQAALRRAAIPRGAYVGDWHYPAVADPERYRKSLRILKDAGLRPVASTFESPENVRGFVRAAVEEGAGVLQTTWAGYESSERAMRDSFSQFAAYVLAADYAWSGRTEMPADLPYRAEELLSRLYDGTPSPVVSAPGQAILVGRPTGTVDLAGTRFAILRPILLRSLVDPKQAGACEEIRIRVGTRARRVAFALDCLARVEKGDAVAEVTLRLAGGRRTTRVLRYGDDVRAPEDPGPVRGGRRTRGMCRLTVDLPQAATVEGIELKAANDYAGLRLYGITVR